jgi:FAD/FMN-containing dehydrogenase
MVTMGRPHKQLTDELRRQVQGEVVARGDHTYDQARRVFNGAIDARPLAVVKPASTSDVCATVRRAATEGIPVAVRCGAHHPSGFATCENGIVVDLSGLNRVRVNSARGTVRFGGGTLMREVNAATIGAGFVSNGGTYETVGTGGLFLNGGVNYLVRRYGYACDQLVGAELVTASGGLLRADEDTNPDVLWGLKGAGACLGVVTEMEARIRALPPQILAGWLLYPHTRAPELLRFMREFVVELPDELFIDVWFFRVAANSYFPTELHNKTAIGVTVVYMGDPGDGERAIKELRDRFPAASDSVRATTYAELNVRDYDGGAWNDRGLTNYWKAEHMESLPDEAIDGLTEAAPAMAQHGDFYMLPIRGGMTRPTVDDAAYGARTPGWVVQIEALWREDEEETDERISWMRELHTHVLEPHGLGYPYPNASMEETRGRIEALYGGGRLPRLRELKQRLDPSNVFRFNPQNVLWPEAPSRTAAEPRANADLAAVTALTGEAT